MNLTTFDADLKLISKQLQKHEKIMSIYNQWQNICPKVRKSSKDGQD